MAQEAIAIPTLTTGDKTRSIINSLADISKQQITPLKILDAQFCVCNKRALSKRSGRVLSRTCKLNLSDSVSLHLA